MELIWDSVLVIFEDWEMEPLLCWKPIRTLQNAQCEYKRGEKQRGREIRSRTRDPLIYGRRRSDGLCKSEWSINRCCDILFEYWWSVTTIVFGYMIYYCRLYFYKYILFFKRLK